MRKNLKDIAKLFGTFFKIGAFTFGGGYAMISLIEEECVLKKGWMSDEELTDMIAIAESTPGPVAVNCATYVGHKVAGTLGALSSTLGVVLPSFIIIYIISIFFDDFLEIPVVAKAFWGIEVGISVIILSVGIKLFLGMKKTPVNMSFFFLALAVMTAVNFLNIGFSSIYIILLAAVMGLIVFGLSEKKGGEK